jgi:hypothetical protein
MKCHLDRSDGEASSSIAQWRDLLYLPTPPGAQVEKNKKRQLQEKLPLLGALYVLSNGLHSLRWRIEDGLLLSCAIDPDAHRATRSMLGHCYVEGVNLGRYFRAGQDSSHVAIFQSTVGIDQLAEKPVQMGTA